MLPLETGSERAQIKGSHTTFVYILKHKLPWHCGLRVLQTTSADEDTEISNLMTRASNVSVEIHFILLYFILLYFHSVYIIGSQTFLPPPIDTC
jgi:hypothetical protein